VLWRHRVIPLLLVTSCSVPAAPVIDPVAARSATVGVELSVMLRAGDRRDVAFDVDSDLDLRSRRLKPTLTRYDDGTAVFRWIPLAGDIGDHRLVFTAAAHGAVSRAAVPVTIDGDAAPLAFRQPAGAGTTLDLTRTTCVELDLMVEDAANTAVQLAPGADWPAGATLTQDGDLTGHARFCPSPAQADAATLFVLSFVARDAAGGRADKRYTVVLGPTLPPVADLCARVAPWIGHTPPPAPLAAGSGRIEAVVTAAQGVGAVTSYWTASEPVAGAAPDLGAMTAVTMEQLRGGAAVGVWGAAPPPALTAAIAPGTSAPLWYLIRAYDEGLPGCTPQLVQAPDGDYFKVTVEAAP
jgi:hypothetical protein